MSIYNYTKTEDPQTVSVKVVSKDRPGLVGEISQAISVLGIKIIHHKAKVYTSDRSSHMSVFEADLYLDGNINLQSLLHKLHKIKGVVSVTAQ